MNDVKDQVQSSGAALCAGTILRGRYRIEKTLGQGGFGITYSALDTKAYRRVAVKELFPSRYVMRSKDQRNILVHSGLENQFRYLQESFEKEAQVLIELQNLEGIVQLMHVFPENNTVYYVMELLEGENLMIRLKREGAMQWEQLAPILQVIVKALEQIHAVGLIHRDISPDNIFLTDKGARLIDFGSVRSYQGKENLTAMVKRNFAPWEQMLSCGHQGPWTDVYALAVTTYYALSGELPPPAMERRSEDKLVPLEYLCPGLPKEICDAIYHGMMVLPEKRIQSVQQFSRALRLEEKSPERTPREGNPQIGMLRCLRGMFAGRSWHMQPEFVLRIGRNPDCDICYPRDYPGISRNQCTICYTREGRFFVKDDTSRYGTRLISPGKNVLMETETWYAADGAHVVFGAQEVYVLLKRGMQLYANENSQLHGNWKSDGK